jgi:hypothetical protein
MKQFYLTLVGLLSMFSLDAQVEKDRPFVPADTVKGRSKFIGDLDSVDTYRAGRCYHKIMFKSNSNPDGAKLEGDFFVKIFEPEFEEYWDTIVLKPALYTSTSPTDFYKMNRKVMIQQPTIRCYFQQDLEYPPAFRDKIEKTLIICFDKVEAEYLTVVKSVPKEYVLRRKRVSKKPVTAREVLPVKRKRLVRAGYFKVLRKSVPEEMALVDASWTKVEGGNWSADWREIISVDCCLPGWVTIIDIQKTLNEKGYSVPTHGKIDYPTKVGLKKYQKDHALIVGRIDMPTLRSLGLVKY